MLEPLVDQRQISIDLIDIATDEALTAEYGIRIPVVKNPADGAELNWPFSRDDVLNISMATE